MSKQRDWQVAPAEHEIANYDLPKIISREQVEEFVAGIKNLGNCRRSFYTISTNVRCAILKTSSKDLDPAERDLYLPLEITLVKWTMRDARCPKELRSLSTKHFMLNPDYEKDNKSNCAILDHNKLHKINFKHQVGGLKEPEYNPYIQEPMTVLKEINSFLTQDRTVFSLSLKYCRQDLGALKWLNQVCGNSLKPIKVLSLEDLYVVLMRSVMRLKQPDTPDEILKMIGQGVARFRLSSCDVEALDTKLQCEYHVNNAAEDSEQECRFCTKALSNCATNVILDDLVYTAELYTQEQIDEYLSIMANDASKQNENTTSLKVDDLTERIEGIWIGG